MKFLTSYRMRCLLLEFDWMLITQSDRSEVLMGIVTCSVTVLVYVIIGAPRPSTTR